MTTTRTARATIRRTLDGATLSLDTYVIAVTQDASGSLSATVDGEPVSIERATQLATEAAAQGTFTLVLGVQRAHRLHLALVELGHKRGHSALAARLLGYPVPHFRDLSVTDAARLWRSVQALTAQAAA